MLLITILCCLGLGMANAPLAAQDYQPQIAKASNEGKLAIEGFRIPKGMTAKLVAAEPNLANPVAFCIDAKGRFYICETFRQQKGVEDNRNHMAWLFDDLAAQTVADRLAYFKKHLGEKVNEYAIEHDRIRLLEDTNGDGVVEKATVFADGFNNIVDGTGAGVLAYRGDVYYTCIPDLWLLKDTNHDGKADERKSLATGFGVRVAFRGHDMHGLVIGPDGRLYFSIGDRGLNVKTKEGKHLVYPDTGAVLRCELDGSNLEVFATGLRNPQELAFDDYGNLFTGDNNSDSGDKARWVYVVPGGESGWRMYYQYLADRGPWNRERMWYPYKSDEETTAVQPSYIVPPIANIADGPSGLTYYPGVGLPERYQGHFFLCDFRGNAANSGIRSFAVKPKGASFELVDSHQFLWSILATDADFGYDGGLYATDWVEGWNGPGKGRLYKFTDTSSIQAVAGADTSALIKEGFDHRDTKELVKLLEHADKRIRQEAQFALVRKNAVNELLEVARKPGKPLPRIHAIWGLGQLIRQGNHELAENLAPLLDENVLDSEIRAQAAKVFGECAGTDDERFEGSLRGGGLARMLKLLEDPEPRVRFFAALGLGNMGRAQDLKALLGLLDENQDADPMLRHAAVMGLVGIGQRHPDELSKLANHPSRYGRMGVLLAMRRLERPEIASFLDDAEPDLVLEAARAINDVPIEAAQVSLAKLADRPGLSDALLRRIINANYRLGSEEAVRNLVALAAKSSLSETLRLEAMSALEEWDKPTPLDRVTGRWRPLEPRSSETLAEILRPQLAGLFRGSDRIRKAGAELAAKYGIKEVIPVLMELVSNIDCAEATRVAALRALADLKSDQLPKAIEESLGANGPSLRAEARRLLARQDPNKAIPALKSAIESGETLERQSALAVLAKIPGKEAEGVLSIWLDRLMKNQAPAEIQLDILEAAATRNSSALNQKIVAYQASLSAEDPIAPYRVALAGGNAERGKEIFFGRSEVSCRRCHLVDGSGGEVGPDLSDIGLKQKRDYLLEAIVHPNKQIAKGFESVLILTTAGEVITGVFKSEDEKTLRLMNKDGGIIIISQEDIEERAVGKSGMPEDLVKYLTKSDVRDLVEYLSTLKTPPAKPASQHKE